MTEIKKLSSFEEGIIYLQKTAVIAAYDVYSLGNVTEIPIDSVNEFVDKLQTMYSFTGYTVIMKTDFIGIVCDVYKGTPNPIVLVMYKDIPIPIEDLKLDCVNRISTFIGRRIS